MGPKPIAVVLVVLVGAVAVYDLKFLVNRSTQRAPKLESASEAAEQTQEECAVQSEQPAAPESKQAPEPAAEPAAAELPPVLSMAWSNPFNENRKPLPPDAVAGPTVAEKKSADPFAGVAPVISAVLISESSRRAVIDRQIMAEGDVHAASGAELESITPSGVVLRAAGQTWFFPMGNAPYGNQN